MLGRWDKRIVDQESDVPCIIFFILFIDLGHSKLFILIFVNLEIYKKLNWNDFCKEFYKKLWKKPILGTSDGWSMSLLSQQPSEPAYYIKDCWISINQYLAMDDFQSLLKNVKKPTENQSMLSKYFGLKETCCSIFLKSWLGTNPNQPHMFRRACDYCFQCWIACHVENESVSPAPFLINTTVLFSLEWTHLWSIQLSTCLSSSSFFVKPKWH